MRQLCNELATFLADASADGRLMWKKDYLLSSACSFRIGGPADHAVWPADGEMLAELLRLCRRYGYPFRVVGNGTNLLFADDGLDGFAVFTTGLNRMSRQGDTLLVEGGVSMTRLSAYAAKEGLAGLSFAYGIPGTLGGGVYMNAGAYGGEIKDVVTEVRWYDPETDCFGVFDREACVFGYRESAFQSSRKIVISATLHLTPGDPETIRMEMNDYMARRKEKQPLEYPSAGSAFKRYPGYFTARLIDEAGLKGLTVGGAQVSEKHAGFIINCGGATSADVRSLIERVRNTIYEKHGFFIEPEIQYVPGRQGGGEA